jgi:hypothetical protein
VDGASAQGSPTATTLTTCRLDKLVLYFSSKWNQWNNNMFLQLGGLQLWPIRNNAGATGGVGIQQTSSRQTHTQLVQVRATWLLLVIELSLLQVDFRQQAWRLSLMQLYIGRLWFLPPVVDRMW